MTYNPEIHHRKSIRLKGVGYAGMGAYFMTVCTHQRALLFENPMCRAIVEEEWRKTETVRSSVRLDEFVCMPNHLHGIIWFVDPVGAGRGRGVAPRRCRAAGGARRAPRHRW